MKFKKPVVNYPFLLTTSEGSIYTAFGVGEKGGVHLLVVSHRHANTGHVYTDNIAERIMIQRVESGQYIVSEGAITEAPDPDATTLTLKIETDASDLTATLAAANKQAKELEATLQRIKNIFN